MRGSPAPRATRPPAPTTDAASPPIDPARNQPAGVSIVLTAGPEPAHLDELLDSLFAVTSHRPLELLLVIHGAGESVRLAIDRHRLRCFCRHLDPGRPISRAEARNRGAAKARHPYLLFLDGEFRCTVDFLPRALALLEDEPDVGLVGLREVGFRWNPRLGTYLAEPIPEDATGRKPPLAATGRLLLTRRADWAAVQGFDRELPSRLEDIDFCLKLGRDLGKTCRILPEHGLVPVGATPPSAPGEGDDLRLRERWSRYLRDTLDQAGHRARFAHPIETRTTILFVLPGHYDSNNGNQVRLLASQIQDRDHDCLVAYPDADEPVQSGHGVTLVGYKTLLAEKETFFAGKAGPDYLHAWTPRETVRRYCETWLAARACPLIVHLEDNEEYLTARALGQPVADLTRLSADELDRLVPQDRYHPIRGRRFLDRAHGLTLVIEELASWNTLDLPSLVIPPLVDERLFQPRPVNLAWRRAHGIDDGCIVLAYTGNIHAGNREEVASLYRAVALLGERGLSVRLLRTGTDPEDFQDAGAAGILHLGWVGREQVPEVLSAADILVQPGLPGPFNDQRIPCKLPEFFAVGRPVVLPRTNLGRRVRHGQDAYVLDRADAEGIAEAVAALSRDGDLRQRLADGARDFYRYHYRVQIRQDYLRFLHTLDRPPRQIRPENTALAALRRENDLLRFQLEQAHRDLEACCAQLQRVAGPVPNGRAGSDGKRSGPGERR